jgi:hypothetical protein
MTGTLWMYSRYTKFVNCVHHQVLSLECNDKNRVSVLFLRWKTGEESTQIGPIKGAPYSQPLSLWLNIPNLWLSYIQLFPCKAVSCSAVYIRRCKVENCSASFTTCRSSTSSNHCQKVAQVYVTNEKINNCPFCPVLFAVFRFHVSSVSSAYINFSYMFWSYDYRHGDQISTSRCLKVYTYVYSL